MNKIYKIFILFLLGIFLLVNLYSEGIDFISDYNIVYTDTLNYGINITFNNLSDSFYNLECGSNLTCIPNNDIKIDSRGISDFISVSLKDLDVYSRSYDDFTIQVVDLGLSGSFQVPVKSGQPKFTVFLEGSQSGETTEISKGETFDIKIKSSFDGAYFDNVDDRDGEQLTCTYNLRNQSLTDTISFDSISTNELTLKQTIGASDYTQCSGTNPCILEVNCSDGVLFSTDSIYLKVIDLPVEINKLKLSSTRKPNSKIKCEVEAEDPDDKDEPITYNYSWKLNGVSKSITGNEFDCLSNGCKANDDLTCIVSATALSKTATKSITEKIDSYISDLTISGKDKIQVGEEITYNATVNYSGPNKISYSWVFGDGTTAGNVSSVKHIYKSKGTYTITLTATDSKGSTYVEEKTINVVDADIKITLKSPTSIQELEKGSKVNVKVSVSDNTGTAINDAKVYATFFISDTNFEVNELKAVSGSAGLYEGNINSYYLFPNLVDLEISAKYSKGGISLNSKNRTPINFLSVDNLTPEFKFITKYDDSDFTVGNIINQITVCFKFPDNSFDTIMNNTKLILDATDTIEYPLTEISADCYNVYPDYRIQKSDLDTKINFKFKDAVDISNNFVKTGYKKTYDVNPLPKIFDLILLEPKTEKINYGQNIFVKAKPVLEDIYELSKFTNLEARVIYNGKDYPLEVIFENNEYLVKGYFTPEKENVINFKVLIFGLYEDKYVEEESSVSLQSTTDLKIKIVSPTENGTMKNIGEIILDLRYQNDEFYDENTIKLTVSNRELEFVKINDGKYKNYYSAKSDNIGFFKSLDLKIFGTDKKGNNFVKESQIYTMAWLFPIYVYYILFGLAIVAIILGIIFSKINKRQKEFSKKLTGKNIDELKQELEIAKETLNDLRRKYFKQEISEDLFKQQKIEFEKKVEVLENKLKILESKENQFTTQAKNYYNNSDQKEFVDNAIKLQSEEYNKYKDEIDSLVEKLKPYREKYTTEDIKLAIKQSKDLPDEIIEKIIEKIYN